MLIKEGPVAYFRGLTPSLLLVAPQAGATFTSHNILMSLFVDFSRYNIQFFLKGLVGALGSKKMLFIFFFFLMNIQHCKISDLERGKALQFYFLVQLQKISIENNKPKESTA